MQRLAQLSRRGFLLGAAAAAAPLRAYGEGHAMGRMAPNRASESFNPDVEIELICKRDQAQILSGKPTKVWRYAGNLIKGPPNTLTASAGQLSRSADALREGTENPHPPAQ